MSFESEIDMLLNYYNIQKKTKRNKWINNEFKFEQFISDSIVKAKKFQENPLNMVNEENSAEFVENLLRTRIQAYTNKPVNKSNKFNKLFRMRK